MALVHILISLVSVNNPADARQITTTLICGIPVIDQNISTAKGYETPNWAIATARREALKFRDCTVGGTRAVVSYNEEAIESGRFVSRAKLFRPN